MTIVPYTKKCKLHTPANEEVYAEVAVLWEDHQHQQVVKI